MARRSILRGLLLLSAGLLAGCPKQPEVGQPGSTAIGPQPSVPATPPSAAPAPHLGEVPVTRPAPPAEALLSPMPPTAPAAPAMQIEAPLRDIFFDYDRSTIREDQRPALNENIPWLKANPKARITIEGHTDERGTNEYNLALGDRRAKATRDYLVAAGIEAARIATISYGEERAFVLGHDESAWKRNRRAHFVITSP